MGAALAVFEPVPNPDRLTGEQRRSGRMVPFLPNRMKSPLLPSDKELSKHVSVDIGLHTLENRGQCFWMTVVPKDIKRVRQVLVFFHGLGEHIGCYYQNEMLAFAYHHGIACIGFDMVGHGRSDGLHMMVDSWNSFVSWATAFCDTFVPRKVKEWGDLAQRELPIFATGVSMGGGVLTAVCLLAPHRFNGVILISPMLGIEAASRPSPLIEWILTKVIVRFVPTWPITPGSGADAMYLHAKDREVCEAIQRSNDLGNGSARLRLQTAVELGIVGCTWIQSRIDQFSTPFIVMHASEDQVTSPDMSQKLHSSALSSDKTIRFVEGAWHGEIFQGGPKTVDSMRESFEVVVQWLNDRTPK